MSNGKPILIAGAGVAGLTAALAFARRGYRALVFEQASELAEIGAGLQLSPNATRILHRLGVLERLEPHCVEPRAVVLRRAATGEEIGRVPLGRFARARWGAPYLVAHRGDLQQALLAAAGDAPSIEIVTGARAVDFSLGPPRLAVEHDEAIHEHNGALVVAADGVWSAIRAHGGQKGQSRFIGQLAWRRTLSGQDVAAAGFDRNVVTAFLNPGFHLVAYPMRGGGEINLVAFTRYKRELPASWGQTLDPAPLRAALADAPALKGLADDAGAWTAYPIHVADLDGSWSDPGGLALIGDAAHAMTPFAAQGAAMAIEDAETLAMAVAARPGDQPAALRDWTVARRRRVLRVARRGALNQMAWHAAGPVAAARDMVLRWRGPERLAADLDWLYGWEP